MKKEKYMNILLRYSIKEGLLKGRGYKFQKLYAADYKTYRKKIGNYTIWLWVKGKTIEVNDWYDKTGNIIQFYLDNKTIKDPVHKDSLKVQMNPETGEVRMYNWDLYYEAMKQRTMDLFYNRYKGWQNEIYLFRPDMELLIEEINKLK